MCADRLDHRPSGTVERCTGGSDRQGEFLSLFFFGGTVRSSRQAKRYGALLATFADSSLLPVQGKEWISADSDSRFFGLCSGSLYPLFLDYRALSSTG